MAKYIRLVTAISLLVVSAGAFAKGTFDVTKYGAKGNGTTDSTAAIKKAIDAVPPVGGTVYFPAGTYKITASLVGKSNMRFQGDGKGASIIRQGDGANLVNLLVFREQKNLVVTDLTFDGNKANNTMRIDGQLLFFKCSDILVKGCEIRDGVGGREGGSGTSLCFGGGNHRIVVTDNHIHDNGKADKDLKNKHQPSDGIYIGATSARITNNLIERNSDTGIVWEGIGKNGIPSEGASIAGNILHDNPQGIAVGSAIVGNSGAAASIVGNTITGTTAVNGGSIWVYLTPGATSQYEISIIGNVIKGGYNSCGIRVSNWTRERDKRISDITIVGNVISGVSPKENKDGIRIEHAARVTISNNVVKGCGGAGISMQDATNSVISGNVVSDNNQSGTPDVSGIDIKNNGAWRTDGSFGDPTWVSEDITVTGNICTGVTQKYGLRIIEGSNNILVANNNLRGNASEPGYHNSATGKVTLASE